jgi:outer membrane immunogenic protein
MFKRIALAASVAALTVATPAFAQDAGTWTGFYIGVIGGWDHVEGQDGLAYGVQGGYDFNAGGAVIGLELEASDATTEECVGNVIVAGDELCDKAGRDLYAGIRVGAEVSPGTLLYAKGGYTNGRAVETYEDGTADYKDSVNLDGIRAGAGVEHQFGSNVFVKAEYRYSNYEAGVERHQVVGGVGFRFGGN